MFYSNNCFINENKKNFSITKLFSGLQLLSGGAKLVPVILHYDDLMPRFSGEICTNNEK